MMKTYLFFLMVSVTFIACNKSDNKSVRFYFPDIKDWYILGKQIPVDTFHNNAKVKIVTYYDVKDFDTHLDWLQLFPKALKKYENDPNVKFYFYLYASDYTEVTKRLIKMDFRYPVIYDKENLFLKKNIGENVIAITYILDHNNILIKGTQPLNPDFDSTVEKLIAK